MDVSKKISYEDLLRIIDLCRVVERSGADPFQIDVRASLETLKKHLPGWRLLDELLLDVEALNKISSVIKLQSEWIRHRASSLFIDPMLVELKIRISSIEELGDALIESWHPIVQLEQIPSKRLLEAMDYWNRLLPLSERFGEKLEVEEVELGSLDLEDLIELKILSEVEFNDMLQKLWAELKERCGDEGAVEYYKFIHSEDFSETVLRGYLTSFLVTEGYANLIFNPLEEKVYLKANKAQLQVLKAGPPRSAVVQLNYDAWRKYMEGE